jgi:hypothetical protein
VAQLKWWSACIASTKPSVQTPVSLQKVNKEKKLGWMNSTLAGRDITKVAIYDYLMLGESYVCIMYGEQKYNPPKETCIFLFY